MAVICRNSGRSPDPGTQEIARDADETGVQLRSGSFEGADETPNGCGASCLGQTRSTFRLMKT